MSSLWDAFDPNSNNENDNNNFDEKVYKPAPLTAEQIQEKEIQEMAYWRARHEINSKERAARELQRVTELREK